jgi:hypothetical protein
MMGQEAITKEEAVRLALAELGEASSAELAAFIERRYGMRIDPKFLPLYKASVRDKERLEQSRARARAAVVSQPEDRPSPTA